MKFPQNGSILVRPCIPGKKNSDWIFEFPRLTNEVHERFYAAIVEWEQGNIEKANRAYKRLCREFPEFLDVYNHRSVLEEAEGNEEEAVSLREHALHLGLSALPKEFVFGRSKLPWEFLENRPFLRAYKAWGIIMLDGGKYEEAAKIFTDLLAMHPNDNMGNRCLAVLSNFLLGRPENVLKICRKYPHDMTEDLLYGRPLALFQIGKSGEAKKALAEAFEIFPLIGREIVKRRHIPPPDLREDRIVLYSHGQAFLYWVNYGKLWLASPEAMRMIKTTMERGKDGKMEKGTKIKEKK